MVETGVPGLEQTGWDAAGAAEHPGHLSAVPGSPHRGHRPLLGHPLPGSAEPFSPSSLERTSPGAGLIPARLAVSALVVGSLSYFFLLSLETLCTARSQGAAACASAGRNARASLLVLAAALIRLYDLNILRCTAPALESEELPA